ncbi:MAG: VOC family protein [Pseudomonadota bacterium]
MVTNPALASARLDHLVLATPDLEASRAEFESLGFLVTPKQVHAHFGTANHLVVLKDIYIELLGIEHEDPDDASFRDLIQSSIEAGGGLVMVALTSDDSQGFATTLRKSGFEASEPNTWSRLARTPSGDFEASFTTFRFEPTLLHGTHTFYCKQHTPELVFQAEWMRHANAVHSMDALVFQGNLAKAEAQSAKIPLGSHCVAWEADQRDSWTISLHAKQAASRRLALKTIANTYLELTSAS